METLGKPHVTLTFPVGGMPSFSWLLQCGFIVETGICGSVRCFLRDDLELSPEFIEQAIQSIFLDGKPVDDLDSAHVKDGCTLALSAAMPGLVGATMRRGGYYASLRSGISHKEDQVCESPRGGGVTVKLFNLVASELESALMKKGVWVGGEVLEDFFKSRSADFWARCVSVTVDGEKIPADSLMGRQWGGGLVMFSVENCQHP